MKRRIRVGVVFGGRSGEHEVSVLSARGILSALDPERFEGVPVGIDRGGRWHLVDKTQLLSESSATREVGGTGLVSVRGLPGIEAMARAGDSAVGPVDVVFPIVHGTQGEDGCLQGLLEIAGIAYVGCGVLGSAVGMDKDVAKRLLRDAGIPVVPYLVARAGRFQEVALRARVEAELGFPCFVKPANTGSSLGISKVKSAEALSGALRAGFRYDEKLLIERGIDAREIEVAVLGESPPRASEPGEVRPSHEFYSYEAKYLDEKGVELIVPAELPAAVRQRVQELSLQAFETLELAGLARVDFFLERGTDNVFLNEVNTLPGFTEVSMYSRMWEHSGLSYRDLVTRLIELGLERFERRKALSIARE